MGQGPENQASSQVLTNTQRAYQEGRAEPGGEG